MTNPNPQKAKDEVAAEAWAVDNQYISGGV